MPKRTLMFSHFPWAVLLLMRGALCGGGCVYVHNLKFTEQSPYSVNVTEPT